MEGKEYKTRMNKAVCHIDKALESLEGTEEGDTEEIRKKGTMSSCWDNLVKGKAGIIHALKSKEQEVD